MANLKLGPINPTGLSSEEVVAFRSEPRTMTVSTGLSSKGAPSGLGDKDVKVSEFGLEIYLNACAPTCHG